MPLLILICGAAAGCADRSRGVDLEEPIPTFSSGPAPGADGFRRPRTTLLPTDCAEALPGLNMSALLGQPVDSIQARTVLGQPAPSVGRLERVSCLYRRAGAQDRPPGLELNLAAYATSAAAAAQLTTNVAAERAYAQHTEELAIGTARAVLFGEPGQSVLLVSSGRSSVSVTLRQGMVADELTRQVMIDLAQRVLPNLAPEPSTEPR